MGKELAELQANMISIAQDSDQICVHLAPGGVKAMKGEIAHFKSRLTKCSEQIKEAQDALSEAILSRYVYIALYRCGYSLIYKAKPYKRKVWPLVIN